MARTCTLPPLAAVLVFLAGSCQSRKYNEPAKPAEAPDRANDPALMTLDTSLNWEQLREPQQASLSAPWTDTFWPLDQKGLASRFAFPESQHPTDPRLTSTPVTVTDQVDIMLKAWETKDANLLAVLSPAEKYELVATRGAPLPPALRALLDAHKADYQVLMKEEPELRKVKKELSERREILFALYDQSHEVRFRVASGLRDISRLRALRVSRDPRIDVGEVDARLEKARSAIQRNTTQLRNLRAQIQAMSSELDVLSDKMDGLYAALEEKGKAFAQRVESVSRELVTRYPILGSGWRDWGYYSPKSIDWSWMGHCHGWAPAALYEATPRHAVLARLDGREILFTEGDIRGLLTKVWAAQGPGSRFLGRRCNTDDIETSERGRILDGRICYQGADCSDPAADGQEIVLQDDAGEKGYLIFTDGTQPPVSRIGVVRKKLGNENYSLAVYDDLQKYRAELQKIRAGDFSGARSAVAHLTNRCRDVNPGTYHLALVDMLRNKKHGFVFDKTRSSQVWNQPVFGYAFEYLPLITKGGEVIPGGEPAPVEQLDDAFAQFRAPGTKYLVQVGATVSYGVENGPLIDYQDGADEESVEKDLAIYTLELDASHRIIGGEWGPFQDASQPLDPYAVEEFMATEAPDFLWAVDKGVKPAEGAIRYSLISRIHQCSLAETGLKERQVHPDLAVTVKYVDCPL